MKSTTIGYTNRKGQIVIPKQLRDSLDIDEFVPLLVKPIPEGILISPVQSVRTKGVKGSNLHEILKETQGAWGTETEEDKKRRKKMEREELKAAKRRYHAW